ncbi:ABC-type branched-subunit amino acid transport system substrate-binding protein [Rhodococcus sp. AG1013]|uniref:ABC transporter substrate-binding protein n=1 Tax=Rhodococcus sp. AG1013 TaxID=2183996 RepID=UPI000E2C54AF|nr:ABC transporter substrate-binding protein [Rhodococcus sp. AG1013]RDI30350.1 ABC-type branched-subunit amino acid transport system substrate-binding protein [Rhodococcus sp. AG1013]
MKLKTLAPAIAALATVGLVASGCSNDSSADAAENAATGDPIKVGQILAVEAGGVSVASQAAGMTASIQALNSRGGVSGRPLELIQCDSMGDPNKEVDCANDMVGKGVTATLADFTPASPEAVSQILAAAGIPRIGMNPMNIADFTAPNVFTPFAGSLLTLYANVDALVAQGKTKLSLMRPDVPVAAMLSQMLTPAVKAKGAEIVNEVAVGAGATDYTQFIAAAERNGAQGVIMALPATEANQMADAFEQLGSKLGFALAATGFTQADLQDLGTFATSSIYTSPVPAPSSSTDQFPGLVPFLDDMSASGEENLERANLNGTEIFSWLSVRAFGEVAQTLDTIDASAVMQGFQNATDIDMLGLVPAWTPNAVEPFGIFQRVSNSMMYRMTFDGDVVVTDPNMFDLRTQ